MDSRSNLLLERLTGTENPGSYAQEAILGIDKVALKVWGPDEAVSGDLHSCDGDTLPPSKALKHTSDSIHLPRASLTAVVDVCEVHDISDTDDEPVHEVSEVGTDAKSPSSRSLYEGTGWRRG